MRTYIPTKKTMNGAALTASATLILTSLIAGQATASPRTGFSDNRQCDVKQRNRVKAPGRHKRSRSAINALVFPSLNGYGNNQQNPSQGASGTLYSRIAPALYSDGLSAMSDGPSPRYISNRIFADGSQNLFSENSVTQWAYNWGQFIDHTIGLREGGTEKIEVPFDDTDPLEKFSNSSENFSITRSLAASSTGLSTTREHNNVVSSYIDAWAVYGGTEERLEWLREGPVDGDLGNNGAKLLLTKKQNLPPANFRGDASSSPPMERMGMLGAIPDADDVVIIAGDKRANENIALTTIQTLFAREHNRIVELLPRRLPEQRKFDIARQLVIATQQYITYNEFLPAVGVLLTDPIRYRPNVDSSISHEFATVGYRAHSMIHGEIEIEVKADRYSRKQIKAFMQQGIEIEQHGDELELAVPLNVAFANPQLAANLGIDAIAVGLGGEPQYKNDETIDNQLRSVLFQLPSPDVEDPDSCLDGPTLPACFSMVSDIGVLDVFRGRDHGIADYNTLRQAYGLEPAKSFIEITGEASDAFPSNDPEVDLSSPINDPSIMDFVELRDINGRPIELNTEAADSQAVEGTRRSTLAALLKAIYGDVGHVDAFVGMVSEPHLIGSELGELQNAIWKKQFEALRDGDSNFYLWSPGLRQVMRHYRKSGLEFRQSLADIIVNNTNLVRADIREHMFLTED